MIMHHSSITLFIKVFIPQSHLSTPTFLILKLSLNRSIRMQFNNFVWSLYANSENGKKIIAEYQGSDNLLKLGKFTPKKIEFLREGNEEIWEPLGVIENSIEVTVYETLSSFVSQWKINSIDDALEKYEELVGQGFGYEYVAENRVIVPLDVLVEEDWTYYIEDISLALYKAHPQYFPPYFFIFKFYLLKDIFEKFEILLPTIPKKGDIQVRALYYMELSKVIYDFRIEHGLSPAEICAFLYDFAPNFIEDIEGKELPMPSKAWIIKGGIDDNGDFERVMNGGPSYESYWQGNIDTRRGDILVLYILTPHKKIHFIGRAYSDGFYEPYFRYHSSILTGSFIKVPEVVFSELNSHQILKNNSGVRAHMQGPSGVPLTSQEYDALLGIFKEKGFEISTLPKLQKIDFLPDLPLKDERDVELNLIEPFLKRLGYEEADWIRQMPVRMGRGERNYPDYILGVKQSKSDQTAKLVVEAKYRIASRKQLAEAFFQASSYAIRLQAKIATVASYEGFWLSEFNNGSFDMDKAIHKNWDELQNSDQFHEIKMLIGKGELM